LVKNDAGEKIGVRKLKTFCCHKKTQDEKSYTRGPLGRGPLLVVAGGPQRQGLQ